MSHARLSHSGFPMQSVERSAIARTDETTMLAIACSGGWLLGVEGDRPR